MVEQTIDNPLTEAAPHTSHGVASSITLTQ